MDPEQSSFQEYQRKAVAWLGQQARAEAKKRPGLTESSDTLYRLAVVPFRHLLSQPVGPTFSLPATFDGEHLGLKFGLCAVGVHGAGEHLPAGRHSEIHVCHRMLHATASRFRRPSKDFELLLSLFNGVYRRYSGRHNTLVHSLLHNTDESGSVIEMPLSNDVRLQPALRRTADRIGNLPFVSLPLGRVLPHLCDDSGTGPLHKLLEALWHHLPSIAAAHTRDNSEEIVALYANRIAELLRTEGDPKMPWFCFKHTFERNCARAVNELEASASEGRTLCDALFPAGTRHSDEHVRTQIFSEAAALLQLFFLYRSICGPWFYVIVPRQEGKLRMCFTVGTEKRLGAGPLGFLVGLADGVRDCLDDALARIHERYTGQAELDNQWMQLDKLIGSKNLSALEKKGFTAPTESNLTSAELAHYLVLCQRLAEINVHEGKKLHFDFVVADGLFASAKMVHVSRLAGAGEEPWRVVDQSNQDPNAAMQANEEVVSRIMGNYAFFQKTGMVLFGSRDGHLLYLAKTLDGELKPEEFTEGGGCYLLQVRTNGDIGLYSNGELLLWRRAGEYLVPKHYGTGYRALLQKWLNKMVPSTNVDYGILTDAVWTMSADERTGGTFVLGRLDRPPFPLRKHSYRLSEVLPFAEGLPLVGKGGLDTLRRLAMQDGAVLIDLGTGQVFGRRQLRPSTLFDWSEKRCQWNEPEGPQAWREWFKVLRWGTRHHSALAFSSAAKGVARGERLAVAIITVSSDGDIHVFSGDRPVPDLTYPQPSK